MRILALAIAATSAACAPTVVRVGGQCGEILNNGISIVRPCAPPKTAHQNKTPGRAK
jgi:hypothetical protein